MVHGCSKTRLLQGCAEAVAGFWACKLNIETGHEFLARRRVVAKTSQHSARNKRHPVLMHAPGGHASVGCLYDHGDPLRLQHFLNDVGDLSRQSFLNLKSPGEGVHHARHL